MPPTASCSRATSGYMSIGHGYYIEDGTETNNKLYSNIGILARAAVDNVQNPRKVPGILSAAFNDRQHNSPYHSDSETPTVFWIMNGWNDFQYNFAAGAGACGVCYWLVPGYNSGSENTRLCYNAATRGVRLGVPERRGLQAAEAAARLHLRPVLEDGLEGLRRRCRATSGERARRRS